MSSLNLSITLAFSQFSLSSLHLPTYYLDDCDLPRVPYYTPRTRHSPRTRAQRTRARTPRATRRAFSWRCAGARRRFRMRATFAARIFVRLEWRTYAPRRTTFAARARAARRRARRAHTHTTTPLRARLLLLRALRAHCFGMRAWFAWRTAHGFLCAL